MTDSIYHGAAIGLSLFASNPPDFRVSLLDFGRALAYLGRAGWDNENTLESQGERYTTFLRDLELIDEESRLTETGTQAKAELTLPIHMSLRDLAGQLNPGGAEAAAAEGEAEWAARATAARAGAGAGDRSPPRSRLPSPKRTRTRARARPASTKRSAAAHRADRPGAGRRAGRAGAAAAPAEPPPPAAAAAGPCRRRTSGRPPRPTRRRAPTPRSAPSRRPRPRPRPTTRR